MDRRNTAPYEFIRIAVMLGTLLSLGLICAYFVINAFNAGYANGVRSTAGILLPLVLGGFLAVFNRELFEKFARFAGPLKWKCRRSDSSLLSPDQMVQLKRAAGLIPADF